MATRVPLPDMADDGRGSNHEVLFTHQSMLRGGVLNELRRGCGGRTSGR